MGLHVIVDGYNLIRRSPVMSSIDRSALELGRESLIDRLAAYKRLKGCSITVVFDAAGGDPFSAGRDQRKGIRIKFSRGGETADAVIKRMAGREKERAVVVTSDRDVADFSASQGAAVIGSSEFEKKLEEAEYMNVKGLCSESDEEEGWTPETRKKGPGKKLPKKKRRNRRKIGKL